MKSPFSSFLIFLSLTTLFLLSVNATNYYVDASQGNDCYTGTSPGAPWRTLFHLNHTHFQPGDSIFLKRGEVWKEHLSFSSSGTATQPIVITSYGTGELPIISGVDVYDGWDVPGNWFTTGNNIWFRAQPYNPQRLWIDGQEVLRHEVVDSLDGTRYMWAWENSNLFVYSTTNPALNFNLMETNFLQETVLLSDLCYVVLRDLEIQGGYLFSLIIRGCHHITVQNCSIGSYARQGIQVREYQGTSSTYVTIDHCLLDSKFNFSYGKDKGIDDGIQFSSGVNDCVVKYSIIKDFGHAGIYLKALGATDNGVFNNKIFGNYLSGEHVTYQRGLATDGYENKCHHNEIFYNIIQHTTVRNQINGNHNWIHHNIIDDVKNSIVKPYGVGQGIELQGYGLNLVCHDNRIDNNLIMNCDEPGISFNGNGNPKKNNYVRNNIILNCGRNSRNGENHIGIAIDDHFSIKTNYFQNNCIYSGDQTSPVVYQRGNFLTAQQFNNQNSPYDIASDNIQLDPLLVTPDSLYYYLTAASPCIDAGIDVGLLFDFYGNPIFAGMAPDIGIHEYSGPSEVFSENPEVVHQFVLYQNFPNPFNPVTTIRYQLPAAGTVKMQIFNMLGEVVAVPVNEYQQAGLHTIRFDGSRLSSGMYFYQLQAGRHRSIRKMVLLK